MHEFIPLHHVILLNALLCSYELNTLDACWIAVDVWSNSSRCRQESVYLSRTWCLYTWSYLDILITMLNSINCSTVICSPTVILMLSWEKPLVKPMAPGSIFHHINLPTLSYFHCRLFYFASLFTLYHKNTKNIILSYLSDLTLVSDRVGIDNPLSRWLRGFICLCRCEGLARSLLLDWYLGSQKLREILTLLCCITLSSSRENQRSAQEVARRISGAVAGESTQKSTYQVPITNPYLPHYIICHLPLVFLSPTSPLPFYSPSLS